MSSSAVWPPIAAHDRQLAEQASLARELEWLLDALRETLASLKSGLEECAVLLSPDHGAKTLVLSSLRSESIKGFATRSGTRIIKGDIRLKLASLRPPQAQSDLRLAISTAPEAPVLTLVQLTQVRNLINASLDVIDVTTWTGDAKNADFIAGQLRLLYENVQEAKQTLKGSQEITNAWCEDPLDNNIYQPSCPPNIALHWAIADAALILYVRTLEPADSPPNPDSLTGLGLRERLAVALGAPKVQPHEELGERFDYRGQQVRVKEMSRVESQDPSLLAAMAKLSALEHSVAMSRTALATVMQRDAD